MLNNIFEYLIDNDCIKMETLEELGCNFGEVNVLIQRGILKLISSGVYKIADVEHLYQYGNELITEDEHERANQCFLRCYSICPEHLNTCFRLFANSITKRDYEETFKYFDTIFDSGRKNIDIKLYLFLLSNITTLPEKYKSYISVFERKHKDHSNDDKKYNDKYFKHKMKEAIYDRKFNFAFINFNNMIKARVDGNVYMDEFLIKVLLIQILGIEREFESILLKNESIKDYRSMYNLLINKRDKYILKEKEEYLLKIVEEILQIIENGSVPICKSIAADSDFKAITNGDYELALTLNNEYHKRNNYDGGESVLNLLLRDIVGLINESKLSKSNEQDKSDIPDDNTEELINKVVQMVVYNKCKFNDACQLLNLDDRLILLAKVYVAIEYYCNDDMAIGDRILKEVEKTPDKEPKVKKLLADTKERKKFLKNNKKDMNL